MCVLQVLNSPSSTAAMVYLFLDPRALGASVRAVVLAGLTLLLAWRVATRLRSPGSGWC